MIICVNCAIRGTKTVYAGETHRTFHDRQAEHITALATGNTNYGIVKHHQEQHPGMEKLFSFRINKKHQSSLERQISEALLIETLDVDYLMNSRGEKGFNCIPRGSYNGEKEIGNTVATLATEARPSGRQQGNRGCRPLTEAGNSGNRDDYPDTSNSTPA